jgi:hypothetical protein
MSDDALEGENSIPEEMDHREIGVRMPVMNKVQFLFAPEPCKPLKARSIYVVFLVEKNVRVERRRTCDHLNHEEINGQHEVCTRSYQKHRNEEELTKWLRKLLPRSPLQRVSRVAKAAKVKR